MSLVRLSEVSGLPAATLSRIENNKMSPTFGVLARVMVGLGTDWAGLLGAQPLPSGERLLSFADPGEGQSTEIRQSSARILHSSDAARQLPLLVEVRTGDLDEVGGLAAHPGEEFCYVLSGTLLLHMQGHAPRVMKAGASALFDSSVPHAYVAGASGSAKVLIVSQRPPGYSPEMAAGTPGT
ncbi:HTH-type transcriptional regulator PuuR [Variovorax sp. PBL-E5]|nr:HTH-type transcriptional regulator PuuR [Variovorax sp. PBL-E5]